MELEELARHAIDALEALGLDYALAGGLAVEVWVEPDALRETLDVDIAVPVLDEEMDRTAFIAEMDARTGEAWFLRDRFRGRKATILKFQGRASGLVVDLVLLASKSYAAHAIAEAEVSVVAGVETKVLPPEDLVIFKSMRNNAKDEEAIRALGAAQDLDMTYVEHWARKTGVWARVEKTLG